MIACPNLTIDRTGALPVLRAGAVLRTGKVRVAAGGKGVNVARAAKLLDSTTRLAGFVAGHTGEAIAGMLAEEEIDLHATSVSGQTRSTLVLRDDEGAVTVINEPGPSISAEGWARYERSVYDLLEEADWLVCSGSCPPGAPDDAYGSLSRAAAERGVSSLVDAGGPLLTKALEAGAAVVSPNLLEAEGLLEGASDEAVEPGDDARPRAMRAAERLVDGGAKLALVSAGRHGVAAADARSATWVSAPSVEVVNPIGAGDVFAGAFVVAWQPGDELLPALVSATATAAASVEDARAGCFDPARAAELKRQVQFQEAVAS